MTPQVIDVTGLSVAKVEHLQKYVAVLRRIPEDSFESGPPPGETPEQRAARFLAWAESHPKRDIEIDDDRETIYAGRGE